MNAQQKEMLLRSQQQLEDSAKIIEASTTTPGDATLHLSISIPNCTMPSADWIKTTEPTRSPEPQRLHPNSSRFPAAAPLAAKKNGNPIARV